MYWYNVFTLSASRRLQHANILYAWRGHFADCSLPLWVRKVCVCVLLCVCVSVYVCVQINTPLLGNGRCAYRKELNLLPFIAELMNRMHLPVMFNLKFVILVLNTRYIL